MSVCLCVCVCVCMTCELPVDDVVLLLTFLGHIAVLGRSGLLLQTE